MLYALALDTLRALVAMYLLGAFPLVFYAVFTLMEARGLEVNNRYDKKWQEHLIAKSYDAMWFAFAWPYEFVALMAHKRAHK